MKEQMKEESCNNPANEGMSPSGRVGVGSFAGVLRRGMSGGCVPDPVCCLHDLVNALYGCPDAMCRQMIADALKCHVDCYIDSCATAGDGPAAARAMAATGDVAMRARLAAFNAFTASGILAEVIAAVEAKLGGGIDPWKILGVLLANLPRVLIDWKTGNIADLVALVVSLLPTPPTPATPMVKK